jgi:hypothetical protein
MAKDKDCCVQLRLSVWVGKQKIAVNKKGPRIMPKSLILFW